MRPGKLKKILIVEYELDVRAMCVRAVEAWGHTAIQCSDGKVAHEIICDNMDISLVILDVCLPGLDGRDLINELRKDSRFKELPIIIISGYVRIGDITQYLEMGASRFLPKPFRIAELKDYVDKFLAPSTGTRSNETTPARHSHE